MREEFLKVEHLGVKLGGVEVLEDISLSIGKSEQWAITGESGSGKTTFIHTLAGRHFYSGVIRFRGMPEGRTPKVIVVEQQHRFRNSSNTSELYYQQRFNSADAGNTITVTEELACHGIVAASNLWIDRLHLRDLLSRPLVQLSNGENKRLQLTIALKSDPDLLVLDNPFLGLDSEGRAALEDIISQLSTTDITLLLVSTAAHIPASVTHVVNLEKGKVGYCGEKKLFNPGAIDPDRQSGYRLDAIPFADALASPFNSAIRMENVWISYGDKVILKGVNWQVGRGDCWSVSGPNGAGKSTLLSLITADNPQAYANEIYLFDRKRGTGETIWEIKQKIGFVSPELHLYFEQGATVFEVIASGIFDTIGLFRKISAAQEERVQIWAGALKIQSLLKKRLVQLSTGEQRMALLARALIKNPPLLILDEPCQGLDDNQAAGFRRLIDQICERFDTTLIYVSHYRREIPSCVSRFLVINDGIAQEITAH